MSNPNYPAIPDRILKGAALLGASALAFNGLSSCVGAQQEPRYIGSCSGTLEVPVEEGDTYSGLLQEHTSISDALDYGNAREAIYSAYLTNHGDLPDTFSIPPNSDSNSLGPSVMAGTTVEVPERCDINVAQ